MSITLAWKENKENRYEGVRIIRGKKNVAKEISGSEWLNNTAKVSYWIRTNSVEKTLYDKEKEEKKDILWREKVIIWKRAKKRY